MSMRVPSTISCRVSQCRFSHTHVTKGHKCGRCGVYGHGEIECFNSWMKPGLTQYYHHVLPNNLACDIDECDDKYYHIRSAHHCKECGMRDPHTTMDCPRRQSSSSNSQFPFQVSSAPAPPAPAPPSLLAASSLITKQVKCPICRTDSSMPTNAKKILGLTDKCAICIDNNVEILLTECYHCCVCKACFDKL